MSTHAEIPAGLPAEQLRRRVDPDDLLFRSTAELSASEELIGQDRAIDAIRLSSAVAHRDFNLFVLGPTGTGRRRAVRRILSEEAQNRPAPDDWVYVNNFAAPDRPKALRLPPGAAEDLKTAMAALVDDLANDIPALFESEEYQAQRRAIEQEFGEKHETAMADFADRAKAEDIAVIRTPMGFMLTAIRDGEMVKPEDYKKLPDDEREKIDAKIERLQEDLADVLRAAPKLEKEHRSTVEKLHAEMAERVVVARVADVEAAFPCVASIAEYLQEVREDIIANAELFLAAASKENDGPFPEAIRKFHREPEFNRYAVTVMVSHSQEAGAGAPVVTAESPTLDHLIGRIEHESRMGALYTNITMIKPGALHRANGGYLVLDARSVLGEPYAWDLLKRCLKNEAIAITSLAERLSLVSTTSLEPDPIPLDVRVVLIGDRRLHALLVLLDPDFRELFKIQADFVEVIDRNDETIAPLARLIASAASKDGLRPLSAPAMSRLLEEAIRLADDATKFSLQLGELADIMREAEHYASQNGRDTIDRPDVERAVEQQERRASRIRDRLHEAVDRRVILIDTSGAETGRINGLSVMDQGGYRFGRTSRITARARMGAGKLVDIEREVELGGPLHSKGVMILSGYLASTFALDVPLSLHASLVFEQSYGGVDGDSASSAELYALLSALSDLPIKQGLAVTGSVNQNGEVQAIGGVNEKVEGFFETCRRRGLTGEQGVLIPKSNVEHLMLREDVVAAVRDGEFRVIPVTTINEGVEILTGTPAGERGADGAFPDGSVNARVEARLRDFAERRRDFARSVREDGVADKEIGS